MDEQKKTSGSLALNGAPQVITIPPSDPVRDRKLRVAAYARVSSSSEDQLNSFAAQNAHYTELITDNPEWEFVDVYADKGITGTSAEKRDDFQRLLADCRRGRVGWEMKEGLTLYLGPGDLSLHPMDCCAHSTLRFPLGYYEGFSISLNPDTLSQALPPALALGGVSPQEILRRFCPQGHPMSLPAQTALDHIFSPLYDLPEALRLPYYTLKVQELLLYLSQQAPAGERASNQYLSQQVEIIRAIHDQLMAHPNQRTTIEALAKEYHLNTSTLKAVFKAVYGQPIASHMKHHRMQEAARLLRETDLSIGDIAQQVGYENQSKFSNVFRDIFQVLPTEYRRQQSRDSKTEGRL